MVVVETSCAFRGNGYLELDRNVIANSSSQLSSGIAVLFSTRQPNGLLLWYGQNKGKAFVGEDFLALAVVDGILEFAFRLDGEESFVRHHGIRVDTNQRHVAIIKRRENQASLELDGLTEYGETRPTGKKEIILPGHIFLGKNMQKCTKCWNIKYNVLTQTQCQNQYSNATLTLVNFISSKIPFYFRRSSRY